MIRLRQESHIRASRICVYSGFNCLLSGVLGVRLATRSGRIVRHSYRACCDWRGRHAFYEWRVIRSEQGAPGLSATRGLDGRGHLLETVESASTPRPDVGLLGRPSNAGCIPTANLRASTPNDCYPEFLAKLLRRLLEQPGIFSFIGTKLDEE